LALSQELKDESTNPARIRSLSDGVFAIVLTFLIFRIDIGKLADANTDGEIMEALRAQASPFLGYVLSFFIIGGFWMLHQRIIKHMEKFNREILWLNLQFLFWVSILPLTTSIHSGALYVKTAWILYAANVSIAGIGVLAIWLRALHDGLLADNVKLVVRNYYVWRIAVIPAVFLLSIPVALESASYAHWTPLFVPLLSWMVRFFFSRQKESQTEVVNLFDEAQQVS
jgi:uncharacterized membrane protein